MRLLPKDALVVTGPVDHADWNYRPVLSTISRARFRLVCGLLPDGKVNRLLELGYGSGIFLPELATRCHSLFALDVHDKNGEVADKLTAFDVDAVLTSGSAEAMPYPAAFFDRIVCVSSLEFIPDIDAAVGELARVLAPGGAVVCVTPASSPITDFGLKVLTGESAKKDYGDKRERLQKAIDARFTVRSPRRWPPVVGRVVPLYRAMELVPR
jgi:ubiquinone/menaquinone biosynthesis C-methylase UbiE